MKAPIISRAYAWICRFKAPAAKGKAGKAATSGKASKSRKSAKSGKSSSSSSSAKSSQSSTATPKKVSFCHQAKISRYFIHCVYPVFFFFFFFRHIFFVCAGTSETKVGISERDTPGTQRRNLAARGSPFFSLFLPDLLRLFTCSA